MKFMGYGISKFLYHNLLALISNICHKSLVQFLYRFYFSHIREQNHHHSDQYHFSDYHDESFQIQ